jgi:hypothetical protein
MSKPFEFNGVAVKTPDSFTPNGATTSTEDSDRTQDLIMHNTPMGTIESYSFEWRNIETEEAAKIIQQIKDKSQYTLRYMSVSAGVWTTGDFYTSNYSVGSLKNVNGGYAWESLSFNAVSINPV